MESEFSSPLKKIKKDEENGKVTEGNGHGGIASSASDGNDRFTSLKGFEVVRILNSSEETKSLAFEAKIKDKEGTAVVMLQVDVGLSVSYLQLCPSAVFL